MFNHSHQIYGKFRSKSFFLSILFIFLTHSLCLYAEADNGKFLPNDPFGVENFYIAIEPVKVQFPIAFSGFGSISSVSKVGYGISGEFGYNWSGWLLGPQVSFSMYRDGPSSGPYSLMENFQNLSTGLRLSRVLSNRTIKTMPKWLELVPAFGFGVNFVQSDYYPSQRAKKENRMRHLKFGERDGIALYYTLGFHTDFHFGTDFAIPYVGLEYIVFVDKNGVAGFPDLFLGIRCYPGASKRKAHKQKKAVAVADAPKAEPDNEPTEENFSSDGDGDNDEMAFRFDTGDFKPKDVASWKFKIFDPAGNPFKTFSGKNDMPTVLKWDGSADNPDDIILSLTKYKGVLDAKLKNGETRQIKSDITTGLLLEKQGDGSMRIRVNSIYFDPDAATFKRITKKQKKANKHTFDILAQQLKNYSQYDVRIEGHANNVSGSEKEDREELIPLSLHRAETIEKELNKRGVPMDRMTVVGKGGSEPLASRENKAQWWKNRRVEFVLIKQN